MRCLFVLFVLVLPWAGLEMKVQGQELFPGQNELALGLGCHTTLDLECARSHLEKALSLFSPEKDPHYVEHICSARRMLAEIHVANDDLQEAEREFVNILLLNDSFELPPGDHPPKLRYVFVQAKAALDQQRKRSSGVPSPQQPQSGVTADLADAKPRQPDIEINSPPATTNSSKVLPQPLFQVSPEARVAFLFGQDSKSLGSGPGASLIAGLVVVPDFARLRLFLTYAHHASQIQQADLQALSALVGGDLMFSTGNFRWYLGVAGGALSMGTSDRYDNWGFVWQWGVGAEWPKNGAIAARLSVYPSFLFTASKTSFFLPVGLALEWRW